MEVAQDWDVSLFRATYLADWLTGPETGDQLQQPSDEGSVCADSHRMPRAMSRLT
jgi:hypothetical protein